MPSSYCLSPNAGLCKEVWAAHQEIHTGTSRASNVTHAEDETRVDQANDGSATASSSMPMEAVVTQPELPQPDLPVPSQAPETPPVAIAPQEVPEVPVVPEVPQRLASTRTSTMTATASLSVPGGRISFYITRGSFEAQCYNKAHGKCTLSRTCNGRRMRGHDGIMGGRPVPFLALWLGRGGCANKALHWDRDANTFSKADRLAKRREIEGMELGRELLGFEREKAVDEESEAEDLAGIWP